MTEKKLIIEKFKLLIELMKMEVNLTHDKDNKNILLFKIDALERNARIMEKLHKDVIEINDIKSIKGFGKGTLLRVEEISKTGDLSEIKFLNSKLKKLYKLNLLITEISKVIGIGSITALRLIEEWNITSLNDLKKRVKEGKIIVNDKIKLGLKYEGKYETNIKRKYITKLEKKIKESLDSFCNSMICGSYRRQSDFSHDIDLLIWKDDLMTQDDIKNSDALKVAIKKLKSDGIISDDITSENVKTKYMGFAKLKDKLFRFDIRLIAKESLYTAILYFTGSYETNIKMRNRAKKLALKLNEYHLMNVMGKVIPVNSEEEIFKKLQMRYLDPYER